MGGGVGPAVPPPDPVAPVPDGKVVDTDSEVADADGEVPVEVPTAAVPVRVAWTVAGVLSLLAAPLSGSARPKESPRRFSSLTMKLSMAIATELPIAAARVSARMRIPAALGALEEGFSGSPSGDSGPCPVGGACSPSVVLMLSLFPRWRT